MYVHIMCVHGYVLAYVHACVYMYMCVHACMYVCMCVLSEVKEVIYLIFYYACTQCGRYSLITLASAIKSNIMWLETLA